MKKKSSNKNSKNIEKTNVKKWKKKSPVRKPSRKRKRKQKEGWLIRYYFAYASLVDILQTLVLWHWTKITPGMINKAKIKIDEAAETKGK